MPDVEEKDERAERLGLWLLDKRAMRGYSRPELVAEVLKFFPAARFSQDYLAKLEYGDRSLAKVSVSTREAIRQALGIKAEVWTAETGLAAPSGTRRPETPEDMRGLTPYRPGREVRHLGKVAAGRYGAALTSGVFETRRIPDDIANGYPEDQLFTLEVVGDSMSCADVRFEVPEGSTVVVHSGLDPMPGDIVSVWLVGEEIGVLKVWKPQVGARVLEVLSPQGERVAWPSEADRGF